MITVDKIQIASDHMMLACCVKFCPWTSCQPYSGAMSGPEQYTEVRNLTPN